MDDREMLELAAKAAGYALEWDEGEFGEYASTYNADPDGCLTIWDPLEDDGDALRLAVMLGIGSQSQKAEGNTGSPATVVLFGTTERLDGTPIPRRLTQLHDGDPYAATRRAIVRAAAEIGRQMP